MINYFGKAAVEGTKIVFVESQFFQALDSRTTKDKVSRHEETKRFLKVAERGYGLYVTPARVAGCHWVVYCMDFAEGNICCLDSYGMTFARATNLMAEWMEVELKSIVKEVKVAVPRQINTWDCGVHAIRALMAVKER